MTPHAFDAHGTCRGVNSYQVLSNTLLEQKPTPKRILDLACGDGHLVEYLSKSLGGNIEVIGVDISEHELEVARSKKYGSVVSFKCERGHQISEHTGSFDAVVCHMALMLMNPVQPVMSEMHRLLRPLGVFAAVIGISGRGEGFFATYQKIFGDFMKEKYPKFVSPPTGDPQIRSIEGLRHIFAEADFTDVQTTDFGLKVKTEPASVWNFFRDMYLVSLLPIEKKEELRVRVISAAEVASADSNLLDFEFPMRLVIAHRN